MGCVLFSISTSTHMKISTWKFEFNVDKFETNELNVFFFAFFIYAQEQWMWVMRHSNRFFFVFKIYIEWPGPIIKPSSLLIIIKCNVCISLHFHNLNRMKHWITQQEMLFIWFLLAIMTLRAKQQTAKFSYFHSILFQFYFFFCHSWAICRTKSHFSWKIHTFK